MIIDRIDEEFLLFALRPDGRWATPDDQALTYGLAGSWLAELLIEGRLRLEGSKLVNRSDSESGDPTLDWALKELRQDKRPRRADACVTLLGKQARPHIGAVMRRLEGRGHVQVATEEQGASVVHIYKPHDAQQLDALTDHLKKVMFGTRPPDESTIALLAMIDGAGLTPHVFGASLCEQARLLIERLVRRDERMHVVAEAVRSRKSWWSR